MKRIFALLLASLILVCGCAPAQEDASADILDISTESVVSDSTSSDEQSDASSIAIPEKVLFDISQIPQFDGDPFVVINENIPFFTEEEITAEPFESYSELDQLGRCDMAMASVGTETMPTEERGEIGSVRPTGWHTVKYDNVDGKYLYNRCHLIGFQLTGENANVQNLITGTRYMNVEGMLPFENMIADYVKETENHVMYRVTPIFVGENLLAHGVLMEAVSVEDNGEGICFNVFCYNAQPGITIDYATGDSEFSGGSTLPDGETSEPEQDESSDTEPQGTTYVLNTNSKKFHEPDCGSAKKISDKNREETQKSRDELMAEGYSPCGNCEP